MRIRNWPMVWRILWHIEDLTALIEWEEQWGHAGQHIKITRIPKWKYALGLLIGKYQ